MKKTAIALSLFAILSAPLMAGQPNPHSMHATGQTLDGTWYHPVRDALISAVTWGDVASTKLGHEIKETSGSVSQWSKERSVEWGSDYNQYRNVYYLKYLDYKLKKEVERATNWDKALARAEGRAEQVIRQIDGKQAGDYQQNSPDREHFENLNRSLKKKRHTIQIFTSQLAERRTGIPRWINLIEAKGVNQTIEKDIKDTELLLSRSQNLTDQDWLIRSPEQLWLDIGNFES